MKSRRDPNTFMSSVATKKVYHKGRLSKRRSGKPGNNDKTLAFRDWLDLVTQKGAENDRFTLFWPRAPLIFAGTEAYLAPFVLFVQKKAHAYLPGSGCSFWADVHVVFVTLRRRFVGNYLCFFDTIYVVFEVFVG